MNWRNEMLTFNLKKQWYEKIRSDEKTIEYREVKDYWTSRFLKFYEIADRTESAYYQGSCILRLGYTRRHMTANITEIEIVDGRDTDLQIDKPVYAIHLADVKEVTE